MNCSKQPYESRADAEKAIRLIRKRSRRHGSNYDNAAIRAYLCNDGCAGVWHLTSNPNKPTGTRGRDFDLVLVDEIMPRGRRNVPVSSLIDTGAEPWN